MNLGRAKTIAAFALGLLLACSTSFLSSSADDLQLSGPDVVTYSPPGQLLNATRLLVRGVRTLTGGCAFPVDVSIQPSQQRFAQYELARQTSTCTSLVERGTPVQSTATSRVAVLTTAAATQKCPPGEFENGCSPDAYPKSCLYTCQSSTGTNGVHCTTLTVHAFFVDPLRIQVAQAFDTIAWWWPPYPGCAVVFPGRPNSGWDSHEQAEDGWSLNSHSFTTTAYPSTAGASGGCTAQSTSSVFTWDNSIFCRIVVSPLDNTPTIAELNPTTIVGNTDGTGQVQIQPSVSGGCSSLLSFNYDIQQLVDATDVPDYGLPGYPPKTTPV